MTEQEEIEFLGRAMNGYGRVDFIKRNETARINRYMVTVGNISIPMDVTDELWMELRTLKR